MGVVFLLEIGALLLAAIVAAAFMAAVPTRPVNAHCDLGLFELVPHILVHRDDYCLLLLTGGRYTALYYLGSLATICIAHHFYVSRRQPARDIEGARRAMLFSACFWALLISWLFDFHGPRGDWGSLTNGSRLPFSAVIILMCVFHVAYVLSRYQLGRPGDAGLQIPR
jgi:hypothetical protein